MKKVQVDFTYTNENVVCNTWYRIPTSYNSEALVVAINTFEEQIKPKKDNYEIVGVSIYED